MEKLIYPIEQENAEIVLDASLLAADKVRARYEGCGLVSSLSADDFRLFFLLQQWVRSSISPKKIIRNQRFFQSVFEDCKFHGKYISTDFGFYPGYFPEPADKENKGYVLDCDFSAAHLHLVRFFCDIGKTQLPTWPFFTVFRPEQSSGFFDHPWPGSLSSFFVNPWKQESLYAYVFHAPTLIKDWAPEMTLDDLKHTLSSFDFVKLESENRSGTDHV